MLKHKFLIDSLRESQKIRILTDISCLADVEFEALGIPSFKLSNIEEYKRDVYPSPASLANSWNLRVVSDISTDMAVSMTADGVNTVCVPSPVPQLNVSDLALSEDPLLSSKFSGEYITAFGKLGMGTVLDGAYLDDNDISCLDKEPNARFLNEFVLNPIKNAAENKKCNGIVMSAELDIENYRTTNSDIVEKITVGEGTYFICKNVTPENTVDHIIKGHICFNGSEVVLKTALDRYKRLKKDISIGKVSVCELNAEIENGSAFLPDKIDEAVDRALEFVFQCTKENKSKIISHTPSETIVKNACYESTVLLKNSNNALPLKKGKVVALVGDILVNYSGAETDNSKAAEHTAYYMRNQGCAASCFCRGYSMHDDRNESLLEELDGKLSNVDTVVLFMGTNYKKEKIMSKTNNLYLPANQLAALVKIRSMGKKIIAVVSSDASFDVTFDRFVDALLVAPLNTKAGIESVIDVIVGKFAPIGRLARTLYRDTEQIIKKQSYYLGLPNIKVGTFIGYRYYDSVDFDVAYPFGYGLGYTSFKYSKISIKDNVISFTVKNKGKSAGVEVAQVYIGINNSNRLSPKKELIGFEKIILQAGESERVRIPIPSLEIFDAESGKWVCEKGEYTVYVGASVSDIRLEANILLGDVALEKTSERASDYLQSETNIISDRYTLEADYKLMKKGVRNIIFGIGSLCLAIAMFLFSLIAGNVQIFFIIIAAILAIAGVVFFILEGSDRSKFNKSERERINAANKEAFSGAEQLEGFSVERVFADEFDKIGTASQKTENVSHSKKDDHLKYVNQSLNFKLASEQFTVFASAHGCKLTESSVKEIFAAMSSSRLIITKGLTRESFSIFIKALAEYFGTDAGVDAVDHTYTNESGALLKKNGSAKQKTALANAIEKSGAVREKVHIAALTDVTFAEMSNYFVPFARYIRNPHSSTVIEAIGEGKEKIGFKPSENLWFFINLKLGENMRNIPSYVAELASVINLEYSAAPTKSVNVTAAEFNYYQFDFMLEKIKANNGISEDTWKKIDSLESFIRGNTSFVLGNRICIGVERFCAVFNACGGEQNEAFDRALSARIIPSAVIALNNIEKVENKNLSEKLEMIFGAENVEISRSAIKSSGTSVF